MVKISVSKARERLAKVAEMSQSEPVVLQLYGKLAEVLVSPDKGPRSSKPSGSHKMWRRSISRWRRLETTYPGSK